jgi:hypothetical protein
VIGKHVIIRTYSAGVHFGILVRHEGREVELLAARRIWRWRGANTLNEVSVTGIDKDWSRVSEPVDRIVLTEAIEIIPATDAAAKSIGECGWAT